jgi:predicted outer membrane repeat protein
MDHRLTRLIAVASSSVLVLTILAAAPAAVRAGTTAYIGDGTGSGECDTPDYLTDGSADDVEFDIAVGLVAGDVNNILYVCPGTYDIGEQIDVPGALTIEGVSGAAATVLDSDGTSRILQLDGDAIIRGLTFKDGDTGGPGNGGAIRSGSSSGLTVEDSVFVNNQGGDGGAIYTNGDLDLVADSTFTGNEAEDDGGAIYTDGHLDLVADSTFTGNEAAGQGGAIYAEDAIYDVDEDGETGLINNSFTGNISISQDGGAVFVDSGVVGSLISGNIFSGNEADGDGGAIYVSDEFNGSLLSSNSFDGNRADEDGGAFFLDDDLENGSQILDNTFSNNTSGDDGGAVMLYYHMDEGTLISGNTFVGNEGDLDDDDNGEGGGLQIDEHAAGTISKNVFTGNEAGRGGGLYIGDLHGTAVITMNTFRSNIATDEGGGAWIDDEGGESSELAIFTKNSFLGNLATDSGGGLHLQFNDTELAPRYFTRNMYRSNRAGLGGAIAFKGLGSDAADCSSPLTSSRAAARIFKKDRFASNRATGSRRTASVGLVACEVAP